MTPYARLGDMLVVGQYSPKMMKALAVIAARLHPAYDELPYRLAEGSSKNSCLFSSLAAREFLVGVGFSDATVRPCTMVMRAERDGVEVHSLGIGVPDRQPDQPDKWNGHAAVIVPSEQILIDVTLYQAIRPQWEGAITGMMAVQLDLHSNRKLRELKQIAGAEMHTKDGAMFCEIAWGDRPDINWRRQPDATDAVSLRRRRAVAKALRQAFGEFDGVDYRDHEAMSASLKEASQ